MLDLMLTARTYEYFVAQQKNPFEEDSAYLIYKLLNIEAMNQAAKRLFEFQDFTSFSKSDTQTKTNNCKIMQAYWEKREICWFLLFRLIDF